MERGGLAGKLGGEDFFRSRGQAIVKVEKRGCKFREKQLSIPLTKH